MLYSAFKIVSQRDYLVRYNGLQRKSKLIDFHLTFRTYEKRSQRANPQGRFKKQVDIAESGNFTVANTYNTRKQRKDQG